MARLRTYAVLSELAPVSRPSYHVILRLTSRYMQKLKIMGEFKDQGVTHVSFSSLPEDSGILRLRGCFVALSRIGILPEELGSPRGSFGRSQVFMRSVNFRSALRGRIGLFPIVNVANVFPIRNITYRV